MEQGRKAGKKCWRRGLLGSVLAGLLLALLCCRPAPGQQFLQYGFESRDPVWTLGRHEAVGFNELAHRLVGVEDGADGSVHSGQRSELLHFTVESGSVIHYTYPVGDGGIAAAECSTPVSFYDQPCRRAGQVRFG